MKKVLIVSPHFPPVNAPDMQRVRLILPHLRAVGWDPTVLAIAPESIKGAVLEPRLEQTYPAGVRIVRVPGIAPAWTRWTGFDSLWRRCGPAFARAGARLLAAEKFDLVFFSTTQFSALALGPRWQERFGVPFVVDYQDPWVNDYYERTGTRPPGGVLKYAMSQWGARRDEPRVLRAASGIIAVSDAYPAMLARLYPWFQAERVRVLPFGAAEADFAALGEYRPAQPLIDFADGNVHHVYTGRAGADMNDALTVLFRAVRRFRGKDPAAAARLRFHFIGTGYAPPPLGQETVMPVAQAEGVADVVQEHCYRVPYFDALYYLRHAHALVAVGSNDATYSASKIFPYVLARRPLLLIFHERSPVLAFAREVGAGLAFGFGDAATLDATAAEVAQQWFEARAFERSPAFNAAAFAPYTAAVLTAQLAETFNAALREPRRSGQ